MRPRKFPPASEGSMVEAYATFRDVQRWAFKAGFVNVAERMKWACDVLAEHIDRDGKDKR